MKCKKCNSEQFIKFKDHVECLFCGAEYPLDVLDEKEGTSIETLKSDLMDMIASNEQITNIMPLVEEIKIIDPYDYLANILSAYVQRFVSNDFKQYLENLDVNQFSSDEFKNLINYLYTICEKKYRDAIILTLNYNHFSEYAFSEIPLEDYKIILEKGLSYIDYTPEVNTKELDKNSYVIDDISKSVFKGDYDSLDEEYDVPEDETSDQTYIRQCMETNQERLKNKNITKSRVIKSNDSSVIRVLPEFMESVSKTRIIEDDDSISCVAPQFREADNNTKLIRDETVSCVTPNTRIIEDDDNISCVAPQYREDNYKTKLVKSSATCFESQTKTVNYAQEDEDNSSIEQTDYEDNSQYVDVRLSSNDNLKLVDEVIELFENGDKEEAFEKVQPLLDLPNKCNNIVYYYLADYYNDPKSNNYDKNEAKYYHNLAETSMPFGDNEALGKCYFNLGLDYHKGIIVNKDHIRALSLFEKSCTYNYPEAYFYCGRYILDGLVNEANETNAKEYLLKGLNLNDKKCIYQLALIALSHQDYEEAIHYLEKGEEVEDENSIQRLGYMYYAGEGVNKDIDKALHYFRKAAKLDDVDALMTLGNCYLKGRGVEINVSKAREYFYRAGQLGDQNAYEICQEIDKILNKYSH